MIAASIRTATFVVAGAALVACRVEVPDVTPIDLSDQLEDDDDEPEPEPEPEVTTFDVALSGGQEVPPVDTDASGEMTATLEGNTLTVEGSFEGLSSDLFDVEGTAAHIHDGLPGVAGPIAFDLEVDADDDLRSGTFTGTFELSDEQVEAFLAGRWYVNVHSEEHQSGELRGQLDADFEPEPEPEPLPDSFDVVLEGRQEVPPVDTNATGEATVTLDGNRLTLTGSFEGLSSDLESIEGSPAHIHEGERGESGPIVMNVNVTRDLVYRNAGTFSLEVELSDAELRAFEAGRWYLNIHSERYPAGEIRGQLVP